MLNRPRPAGSRELVQIRHEMVSIPLIELTTSTQNNLHLGPVSNRPMVELLALPPFYQQVSLVLSLFVTRSLIEENMVEWSH